MSMPSAASRRFTSQPGEAGEGQAYWSSLENGIRATYASMAGVTNAWTASDAAISQRPVTVHTLNAAPNISVIFLRLPDGYPNGEGTSRYNGQSILKLWDGRISSIRPPVDGSATYTKAQLQTVLNQLVSAYKPTTFRTQDWTGNFTTPYDHSDHWAAAKFGQLATRAYTGPHTSSAYDAYVIDEYAQNVTGADLTNKVNAFTRFADFDKYLCGSPLPCPPALQRLAQTAVHYSHRVDRQRGEIGGNHRLCVLSESLGTKSGESAGRLRLGGYAHGRQPRVGHQWRQSRQLDAIQLLACQDHQRCDTF